MIINVEEFINKMLDEYVDPFEVGGVIKALREACIMSDIAENIYLDEVEEKLP